MAYNFAASSSQYLVVSSAVVTGPPFTMACLAMVNDAANPYALMSLSNASSNSQRHTLQIRGEQAGDPLEATSQSVGTTAPSQAGTVTAGVWHHCAGVWAASDHRLAYLNGAAGAENTTTVSPSGLNTTSIGAIVRVSNPPFSLSGRIAEAAIWNVALTAAEIAMLAAGLSPLMLTHRLANLKMYQPLIRDLNVGGVGIELTAVNSPTVAAHPRVIYPSRPIYGVPGDMGGTSGLLLWRRRRAAA